MRIAQRLYEGVDIGGETVGLITYMRTDGIEITPEALPGIRDVIARDFGKEYVPSAPRTYQNKSKNAQEAHEAVRPTDVARHPRDLRKHLDAEQAKLYELIWVRTIASQMESAELERTSVDIHARAAGRLIELRASGSVVKFDGFLKVYSEDRDDPEEDDESRRLPAMSQGEKLKKEKIAAEQHFTEPPPRYSEASLVKRMEELGIGRPSTYASILQVLKDRMYVRLEKRRLYPEDKGRVVVAFLENFFSKYVEYDFTASLEDQLDKVSNNELAWRDLLADFWKHFIAAVNDIKDVRIGQVLDVLDEMLAPHIYTPRPDGSDPRICPVCGTGRLSLRLGKFGAFIGCSNYPECKNTRPLSETGGMGGTRVLGTDPETGLEVSLRVGRFGPYVQLGEGTDEEKPKRSSIPKRQEVASVDLPTALKLLALPRIVGKHPETGEPIKANIGRYGPYVQHEKTYANLEEGDDPLTIGLNRAVTLIAEKAAKGPGKRRFGTDPGKPLGDHPAKGGPVVVKNGKYGPYVSHNGVNATLPAEITPDTVTLAQAVELLDARAGKSAGGARPRRTAGRKTDSAAKKPAAKAAKPAAKPAQAAAKPKEKAAPKAKKKAAG